jgi:TolA-binding protein
VNCEEVEKKDILGAYIAGKLPEAERDQFEEHFFGCERCLEQVEAGRLARRALEAKPVSRGAGRYWWVGALAAAAAVLLGVWIWKGAVPQAPPRPVIAVAEKPARPNYELLARFDPPAYRPSTLRGAERVARTFRDGMKLYTNGDFAGAAAGLRAIAAGGENPEALYYLGISELLSGERESGIADLRKTIAAGDTPYRPEARFYLGKALLGSGDVPGARQQFETLVRDKSELGPEAEQILNQLPQDSPTEMKPAQ